MSAYFTVFAASYLPVHITKISKADAVWANNLGQPLLKARLSFFVSHCFCFPPSLLSLTSSSLPFPSDPIR